MAIGDKLDDNECLRVKTLYDQYKSIKKTSEILRQSRQWVMWRLEKAEKILQEKQPDIILPDFPADDLPIEEIIDLMEKRSGQRKKSYAAHTWYPIKISENKPIGVLWFGDPHLDDQGADWGLIKHHAKLCRETKGLYGANIGDTTNNWSGRLAHLYASQETSKKTAQRLAQWFLLDSGITWLLWLIGNHDCVTPDHEVLTKRGWVEFPDVKNDDFVLGYNEKTKQSEWQSINEIVKFPFKGKLAEYKTRTTSIVCTNNHRFLCKVKDGKYIYRYQKDLPSDVSVISSAFDGSSGCFLTEDEILLSALVLTDGSITKNGYVHIYQSKPKVCKIIEKLLEKLDLKYTKHSRTPKCTHINGVKLKNKKIAHQYLLSAEASKKAKYLSKTIQPWMYLMNETEFSVFMKGICLGDGSIKKKGDTNICGWAVNGSKKELDALQALLITKGWSASMYQDPRGSWRLNVIRKTQRRLVSKPKDIYYNGDVWCLRVPLSNFMIRHNGIAHFTGNSWGDGAEILKLMAQKHKTQKIVCHDWESRFVLQFPSGCNVRVNAAHDFAGNSQWNPLHGATKTAAFGDKIDLLVCGHKHNWAVSQWELGAQETIPTMIRVKGYKTNDSYAQKLGHYEQHEGAAILTILNPKAKTQAGKVTTFVDVDQGVDFLTWLRSKG